MSIRIQCNRCKMEIAEEDEGIPLKETAVGVGEDGRPDTEISVVFGDDDDSDDDDKDDKKEAEPLLRLIFSVVGDDEDDPPDIHFCAPCAQVLLKEYAKKKIGD